MDTERGDMDGSSTKDTASLRARISDLELQVQRQQAELAAARRPRDRRQRAHSAAWAVTSGALLILACLLAPLSVATVWANTQVLDTDQYVRMVTPLAQDPDVQAAVAAEVTSVVLESVDVNDVTSGLLGVLADRPNVPAAIPALAGPITSGIEGFVTTEVAKVVAGDQFARLWSEANRAGHEQVVRLLTGDRSGVVTAQDDAVTLNLAPIVKHVKQEMVRRGFGLANSIPEVDRSFVLFQFTAVTQTQGAYRVLAMAGVWLPLVVLVLFVLGVLAAGDRRRALLRGALGVVAGMLLMGVSLAIGRASYLGSTPAGVLSPAAAGTVFDTLVHSLRTGIRAVAVLGLVVAAIAYLSGPSSLARGSRSIFVTTIDRLRGGAESAGWRSGRVGVFLHTHRSVLRALILIAGGLVVLFWARPTGWVVLGVAMVVAIAVAVLEFLAGAPSPSTSSFAHDAALEGADHTGEGG